MWLPQLLFVLFATFSAIGVFWILSHHRSRAAGALGALVTLLLYVALYAGVWYLIAPALQP